MGSNPIAVISPICQVVANLGELHRIGEKFLKRPISQAVDEAGLRPNSDFAYLVLIGNLEEYQQVHEVLLRSRKYARHLFYSFFFVMECEITKTVGVETHLQVLTFDYSSDHDAGLLSGTLADWVEMIIQFLTEPYSVQIRQFANGFYEVFATLGFGKLFQEYERVPSKDYFFLRKV